MPFPKEYQATGGGGASASTGDSSWGDYVLPVAAGGAALLGGAALAKNAPGMLGTAAKGLNALRQQLMLSGMALPKSMLGNAGAALTASVERGSLKPLQEMFSLETLKDAGRAYKAHASTGMAPGVTLPGPTPGRLMGAFDTAAQGALRRAGLTAEEAANETLQTPLGKNFGPMGQTLESPVASYIHPFRRTPFNQWIEGLKAVDTRPGSALATNPGARRALAMYGAAGAVHGATTSDDSLPVSIPVATAAAGRYGVPYAVAALIGRNLAGGKGGGGAVGSTLPFNERGFESSVLDPTATFRKPAALSAIEKIFGK